MNKLNKSKIRFACVPLNLVNSSTISLQAKGLFSYIEGKPENWKFSASRMAKELKEGVTCIENCLRELEESGYLKREKKKNEKGHWYSEYTIYAVPEYERVLEELLEQHESTLTNEPNQYNPSPWNPRTGNPNPGKVPSHINKEVIKKYFNKEIINKGVVETTRESQLIKNKSPEDKVAKAYYDTLKELDIPVRNHNNLRAKINSLKREIGEEQALTYLNFIRNDYMKLENNGFKPIIAESLDIYAKRVNIMFWLKERESNQSGGIAGL